MLVCVQVQEEGEDIPNEGFSLAGSIALCPSGPLLLAS